MANSQDLDLQQNSEEVAQGDTVHSNKVPRSSRSKRRGHNVSGGTDPTYSMTITLGSRDGHSGYQSSDSISFSWDRTSSPEPRAYGRNAKQANIVPKNSTAQRTRNFPEVGSNKVRSNWKVQWHRIDRLHLWDMSVIAGGVTLSVIERSRAADCASLVLLCCAELVQFVSVPLWRFRYLGSGRMHCSWEEEEKKKLPRMRNKPSLRFPKLLSPTRLIAHSPYLLSHYV